MRPAYEPSALPWANWRTNDSRHQHGGASHADTAEAAELLNRPTGFVRRGCLGYGIGVVLQLGDLLENKFQPAEQPLILANAFGGIGSPTPVRRSDSRRRLILD